MNLKDNPGQIMLWFCVGLGNLEWLLTVVYCGASPWHTPMAKTACVFFILTQPLVYIALYSLYIVQH